MTKQHSIQTFLPVFLVGFIDGLIVLLSTFCFLLGKGTPPQDTLTGIWAVGGFLMLLLAVGAYFTYREENSNNKGNKLLRIYNSLEVNEELKDAMTKDVENENNAWQEQWNGPQNATRTLGAGNYALMILTGVILAIIVVTLNTMLPVTNHYYYLALPVFLSGLAGILKYLLLQKNGWTGFLLITSAALGAALGAYWVAGLF